jgi:hypothetical protein
MSNHWQEAQEQARRAAGCNFVFTPDRKACIAGSAERGWVILSLNHNLKLEARTAQGVTPRRNMLDVVGQSR